MLSYRDQAPQIVSAMSPRPGALGGPPVMQQQQQAGPPGIGMGRGASNTGLQASALAANNPGHQGQHLVHEESSEALNNEIQLNSYIYDHLLKNGFYQAARGLLNEASLHLVNGPREASADQDADGNTLLPRRPANLKRSQSGMDHPNSSPNDKPNGKSPRSGSNSPNSGHADLPEANVPLKAPGGFLREWWCVFWDIYAARSGRSATPFAQAFLETQRNQQRGPQYQQQFNPAMQRTQMMNGVAEEANTDKAKPNLMHTAMINNGRKVNRPGPPGPMQMQQGQPPNQAQLMALQQQAAHRQAQQQAQQQARDNEDPTSSSPAMGNANSPNKRQRLTPPNDQGQVPSQMLSQGQPANGIPLGQQPHFTNSAAAANFLKQSGVEVPAGVTNQDIINYARSFAQQTNPGKMNTQQLQAYKHNLAMQQSQQGLSAARNSIGAGGASPAGQPAQIPFVNPGIPGGNPFGGRDGSRRAPTAAELQQLANQAKAMGGTLQHPSQGSHSLQDYQNQLMVLEQQNKKRLQHARHETNNRSDEPGNGPMNGQFPPQPGQGLQPGHQMQGTSMSPSNSRTGPSPQIANLELQRKAGQNPGSGGASPEPGDAVGPNRGPSPAFTGQGGGMSTEQYAQMTGQMAGGPYGQPVMINGQQFMAGRPHPGMQLGQNPLGYDMMMKQGGLQRPQAGQPYPAGWQQAMMSQPMAQHMRPGMVPGQAGPHAPNPQQQMPPPPQPQPQAARQTTAPSESPSLTNAQPPTPTPGNKPPPKAKNVKEGGRAKRNRGKGAAAPATPNASEPPTPTTPMTPIPPFNNSQAQSQNPQPPAQSQQQQPQQPSEQPAQPTHDAPPSAFSVLDGADASIDGWASSIDEKWMNMPMDFASSFTNLDGFPGSSFASGNMEDDPTVNYSEFLNDNDGLGMDLGIWPDELTGTEA